MEVNIWQAVATGDTPALQCWLDKKGASESKPLECRGYRDNHHWTPLHHAVASNELSAVVMLLKRTDLAVSDQCYEGMTTLALGCEKRVSKKIIWALLQKDSSAVNIGNNECVTPLHLAAEASNMEVAEILIRFGANPNALDYQHESPLHTAACDAVNLGMVIYLLYVAGTNVRTLPCYEDILLRFSSRAVSSSKQKVPCFKLLFNYLNPKVQHRQRYKIDDILSFALVSYHGDSLVKHFVDSELPWVADVEMRNNVRKMMACRVERGLLKTHGDFLSVKPYQLFAMLIIYEPADRFFQDDTISRHIRELGIRLLIREISLFLCVTISYTETAIMLEYHMPRQYWIYDLYVADFRGLAMLVHALDGNEVTLNIAMRFLYVLQLLLPKSPKDAEMLLKMVRPRQIMLQEAIISFCANIFNLQTIINFPSLFHEHGTFQMLKLNNCLSFEGFTLKRLARDAVRSAVYKGLDQTITLKSLPFVQALESLDIPRELKDYMRFVDW